MRTKSLTQTQEDYLWAIFITQRDNGKTGAVRIAKYMNLSKSTVSERLQGLMRQKLIAPGFYSDVILTLKGQRLAEKLTYKHRIAEVFLHTVLKIPKSQVHAEAHKLEHAFSDTVAKRLADFLGRPTRDPHGALISQMKRRSK